MSARVALHFHPELELWGRPVLERIVSDGFYLSQFVTGTSNGGPTALRDGDRWRWEHRIFAGLRVDVDSPVSVDQTVVLGVRFGPITINAPVRVVYEVAEDRERGFAYGTLPSHPEIGEERFTVRIDDDRIVWGEIRAFSRPDRWFTPVGARFARKVQHATTRRYSSALLADQRSWFTRGGDPR